MEKQVNDEKILKWLEEKFGNTIYEHDINNVLLGHYEILKAIYTTDYENLDILSSTKSRVINIILTNQTGHKNLLKIFN